MQKDWRGEGAIFAMRDYDFPGVCILLILVKAKNKSEISWKFGYTGKHNTNSMYQGFEPGSTGLQS